MISITKYINVPVFIISLIVGIFAVYVYLPDTRKIYVYPNPENIDILLYRDKTGQCFKFDQKEVSCPSNEDQISKTPVQT
jgi:hypothetical protein